MMSRVRLMGVCILLLLQTAFVVAFALLAYGHFDEVQRWNRAGLSERYIARTVVESIGCVANASFMIVQVAAVICVFRRLRGRRCGGIFLPLTPFVFAGACGLAMISLVVTPAAGSPHNDIGRGIGSLLLIFVSFVAGGTAVLQNLMLRSVPGG